MSYAWDLTDALKELSECCGQVCAECPYRREDPGEAPPWGRGGDWGWGPCTDNDGTMWVAAVSDGDPAKLAARRAWSPRAQTAHVEARFDAAVKAGRHTWPALRFPDDPMQATALMRMLLWFDQRGRCAGCGKRSDWLLLDHCHVTDLVRGALCHRCNTLEATGPIDLLRDYRRRPPAFWLGWVAPRRAAETGPNVGAVTDVVLAARRSGIPAHSIEAAWGSAWLQTHLPAAAEACRQGR